MSFYIAVTLCLFSHHSDSIVYHRNGAIKEHYIFNDVDIKCEKYDSLGALIFTGNCRYYQQEPVQVEDQATGHFKLYTLPKKLFLDGQVIEYYDSLKIKSKANYRAGVKNGLYTDWYPTGQLNSSGLYKASGGGYNIKVDEWSYYYENGIIKTIERFKDTTGFLFDPIQCGFQEEYYPNGTLKSIGFYNSQGIRDSLFVSYFPNGRLNEFGYYRPFVRYDSIFGGYFYDAVKAGNWFAFDNNSKLVECVTYDNQGNVTKNKQIKYRKEQKRIIRLSKIISANKKQIVNHFGRS